MLVEELDTPSVVVDLDLLEFNINRLQHYLDSCGIKNRPHTKTHKIPEIAHMQIAAGAIGICCQKVGEAEVMVQGGLKDIFIPYNIVGGEKVERLVNLNRRAKVSVSADSEQVVAGLSEGARAGGVEITVLVEFDGGFKRCGTQTPEATAQLALKISKSPGLRFGGIMTFPSNEQTGPFARETIRLLTQMGLDCPIVSGGGSHVCYQAGDFPEVNEHRAGMYIFGDRYTVGYGSLPYEECSFKIHTTVVSRPTAERGILDAGSKTLSSDLMGQTGHGRIVEYPDAKIYGLSEEHGQVDFSDCKQRPEIGERLTIIPNHCCPVTNLVDELFGVRKGRVDVVWPVLGRGKIQ